MVRGFAYLCSACGHGGHPAHLKRWFEQSSECPTGCGCLCGEYSLNYNLCNDSYFYFSNIKSYKFQGKLLLVLI